jgi:hypothetical protein
MGTFFSIWRLETKFESVDPPTMHCTEEEMLLGSFV